MKEHQLQLARLDETVQSDRQRSEDRLKKMHLDLRQKRAKQRVQLQSKQKVELKQQKEQMDKVCTEIERKVDSKQEAIPGLQELKALASAAMGGDPSTAGLSLAETQAMQREHMRLRQELEAEHEQAKRALHQQLAKEEQAALDAFKVQVMCLLMLITLSVIPLFDYVF